MNKGDFMKLRKGHLYIIVTLCFVISFVAINCKYDRFYRVNGINNDNRALIEMYLDEQEQEYLIENAIPVNEFIKYITYSEFNLEYYQFYNALDKTKKYSNYDELISVANQLANKLEVAYGNDAIPYCDTLVHNDLVLAYINQDSFDFDNIDYYQLIRSIYDESDYSYISDTNKYIQIMQEDEDLNDDDLYDQVKELSANFTKTSLATLFNTELQPNAQRIYNPSEPTLVVNNTTYIGGYEPKNLVTTLGIPRTNYSMYLQEETFNHLLEMYRACYQECGSGMILTKAYVGYDVATLEDRGVVAGYNEFQLGNTVTLQQLEISVEDFVETEIYQWLLNHSYEYGFVLRYPADKTIITGHEFNPTIFRYVGVEVATTMHQQNLCLEEYNNLNVNE